MATGMILAQWERAQRQLRQLRRQAAEKTVTVDVAAGMVRVTAAGDMSIRHIVIAPEALQDRQALEELLVTAVNRALEAARQLVEEQLEPVRELLPPWMSAMADSP